MRYVYIERRADPEGRKYWTIVATSGRESGYAFRTKRDAEWCAKVQYGCTIVPPTKTGALR